MSRLWETGAEDGADWDASEGTVSISTAQARTGTHSIRCNPAASQGYIHHQYRADDQARVFYRTHIRFATFPDADCIILAHTDSGIAQNLPGIRFNVATQKLQVWNNSTVVGPESPALSLNVWYRLELDYDDANGDVTSAYLDGVAFASEIDGGDMFGGGTVKVGIITTGITADMYVDDIVVYDVQPHVEDTDMSIRYSAVEAERGNTDTGTLDDSTGAHISVTEVPDDTLENFLPTVLGTETLDGVTKYRCFFVVNDHPTLTLEDCAVTISAQTSGGATVTVASDDVVASDLDALLAQADSGTIPEDVGTFGSSASLGDIGPHQCRAFWLRQVTAAGAALVQPDQATVSFSGVTV